MNAKYADVVKTSEVLTFFDTLPSGMFDLPKGNAPQGEGKRASY
jgi:maleamate amidohydrolase